MKLLWHDWNASMASDRPEIVDASLSELAAHPNHPDPSPGQAVEWIGQVRRLGVRGFEVLTLAEPDDAARSALLLNALSEAGESQGLILTVSDLVPWVDHLVSLSQKLKDPLEVRWVAAAGDPDFRGCHRLCQEGLTLSLVVPNSCELDPIRLNRWIVRARQAGVSLIELGGRRGAPWLSGIQSLIEFVRGIPGQGKLPLSWSSDHGFGLALTQALEAWRLGVQRLRCSLFGCGLQGNVPLELLLVNLDLDAGPGGPSLTSLLPLCQYAEEHFDLEVGNDYPVFGRDAFRTATADHAEAIVKAMAMGETELADRVVSSVRAGQYGLTQTIEVGPSSGQANVAYWLRCQGLSYSQTCLEEMLAAATMRGQVLTDLELVDLYDSLAGPRSGP